MHSSYGGGWYWDQPFGCPRPSEPCEGLELQLYDSFSCIKVPGHARGVRAAGVQARDLAFHEDQLRGGADHRPARRLDPRAVGLREPAPRVL